MIKNIDKLTFSPTCTCKILLFQLSHADLEILRRREQLVERTRREAQLAALQYEEEKIRTKQIQRDAVLDFVKVKFCQISLKFLKSFRSKCLFVLLRLSVFVLIKVSTFFFLTVRNLEYIA